MKKIWNILILLAVVLTGCNNTDGLWDEVHDLQSRLAKLEKQAINLNGNIMALQSLYKDGISITKVEEGDGTYTLTLSNGQALKVVQKMEETIYPVVGIDAEGYWTVGYGSSAPTRILLSGNPVKALGEDGLTPQFRVNSTTGCWEVRYKESEAYQEVKDTNGNSVVADGNTSSDRFFESVGKSVDGKSFNMKLKDGTELSIPITTFSCTFEPSVMGVQRIDSKATKTFKVLLNNVDDITLMTAPAGWTAELSAPIANEATLTVTAPETFTTTRATANNAKEISLLATTSLGLSTILKLQVEVIPEVRVVDYKALYDAGSDLFTIGEGGSVVVVNKVNFTAMEVIDLTTTDQSMDKLKLTPANPTIYFLEGGNKLTINIDANLPIVGKKVLFISKTSTEKPMIEFGGTGAVYINQSSTLAFKNVTIKKLSLGNYGSTGNAANLWIENCHIMELSKAIVLMTGANTTVGGIDNLYFKSNYIEMAKFPEKNSVFEIGNSITTDITRVTIDNNVWYVKGSLLQGSIYKTTAATGVTENLSFSNNTIINYAGNSSNSLFAAYTLFSNVANLTIKDNIGYSDDTTTDGLSNSGSSFYIISNVTTMPNITIDGNIVYGLNPGLANKWKWNTYGWKTNAATKVDQTGEKNGIITRYSVNPFSNPSGFDSGDFTPIPELTGKGATLK